MSRSIHDLRELRERGEKFVMVTAYDAGTARLLDEAGVPVLLVGDSLSQVVLGYPSTIQVSMDEMLHHARAVARGSRNALLVGDLPFASYPDFKDALHNASSFLKAGMHSVKLEGAGARVDIVAELVANGIPVMGHLGLTPQFVNAFGGYRVQGRGDAGKALLDDAMKLQDAGAFALVLECVPAELGAEVTEAVEIPTIGIGAGPATSAQVLVFHDLLGLSDGPMPRFVKRYADLDLEIVAALKSFAKEVAEGVYPSAEQSYS